MMNKEITFGFEARNKMLKGIDVLCDVVRLTLGPKGRNVALDKENETPLIINDGVSIANEITLKDPMENMGVKLVLEAANKTNELAGDGTTTATVLAQEMIHFGMKALNKGSNPVLLKEGIDTARSEINKIIDEFSLPIKSEKEIKQVATISSSSIEIGELITKAVSMVGKDGVITIDESKGFDNELEIVTGLEYQKGYVSPYMVTDKEKNIAILEDAYVLVTDYKISNIQDIIEILQQVVEIHKPLLIIADDFDNDIVSTLIVNKLRGTFNVVATKAPEFGDYQKEILEDIALKTGAKFYCKDLMMDLTKLTLGDLGRVHKVKITKDSTTLIDGYGDKEKILAKINSLKNYLNTLNNKYEKNQLQKRIAQLSLGIGVIKVGALTEMELKEKKLRIEDALNATQAALSEGVVPGGGLIYCLIYKKLKSRLKNKNNDIQKGINIVLNALLKPLFQIGENAGFDGKEIVEKQLKMPSNIGFDAKNNKWVDMIKNGIIDPTKVSRSALMNATSVASMFLLTDALISNENLENKEMVEKPNMF